MINTIKNRIPVLICLSSFLVLSFFGLSKNEETTAACPNILVTGTRVSCYGNSNGSAQVAISNGSGNYTITWSNGANVASINGLPVGTYTVSVKDNVSGCSVVGAYVVTSPDPVTVINEAITNINCFGQNTGAINLQTIGGTAPYTYTWVKNASVVSTAQNLLNAPAGTYTLTIKDANNCTFTKIYNITQPAEALSSSSTTTPASCFASSTGSINLEVWGGTPSYTYLWSTGHSTQDVSNLSAGNYSVQVTDFKGCTLPLSFYVGQPDVLVGTIATTDVNCYGNTNGSLQITPTGGTTPYSYSWQNSSTLYSVNSATLSNIPADNYQVTVTDAKGCKYVGTATVSQPSNVTLSHTFLDVSCYGGTDGVIDLTVTGGTPAYTYNWQNSVGTSVATSQDLNNVIAGIYTVVLTDQNGCTKTITQELKQPPTPIAVEEEIVHVNCYGNNTGEIILSVTGGTGPYSYSWTTGQTTNHITGLLAQTYNYVVLDSKLCSYSNAVTVTQPAQPLTVTDAITHVNCYGESNGTIDLTVTGGTSPYTYTWNNSQFSLSSTTQDLVNYPAESYTYVVKDSKNCTQTGTLTITQPSLLTSTISGVNILCKGGNNGSIDLTVIGGVLPYQFSWNNAIITENQSSLIAGTYTVVITDDHNCTTTNSITLTEPNDSLSYSYKVKDVLCNNGQNGEIELQIEGGTSPYFYDWSNGDTLAEIGELVSAYYEFVVTDNNGCVITDSIFVGQPDPLLLNEIITPVTCYGLGDGEINITPTGGTAPYNYTWLNSDYVLSTQEQDLIGFPADVYQLEVIDSNNCFYEMFMTLPQPNLLELSYTTDIVSCNGGSNGNIFVDIVGGNPAYNTTWSTGATTQDLLDIPAGTYQLVVVDQKGCTDSFTVDITEPTPITVTFEVTEVTCIDQHDGTALALPTGGNGGYFYDWSNGANTSFVDGLSSTEYTVAIVDVLGCTGTGTVLIPKNMSGCINPVTAFTPNGDNYNDTWVIDNMYLYPETELTVFNKWGGIVYKANGAYEPWDGKMNGVDLPSEVYFYIINLNTTDRDPLTGNITIIR